ncbi:hypothetical protein MAPG_04621 [Magnaporthiopsis poae ATCC 64411]|uniref:Uncharacterized protein n=1 Tax=Magnaporthiopsis poae (strain ATCC 64411 / 73-15) TaxID=644358 RepID=A0A0C4DX83_MAGP6|nr:hypothetical protein MAPG_04621 [Magnaporthiopsis poae ATCC 64411]
MMTPSSNPAGMVVGMSLRQCSTMSTSPAASIASSSLVHRPLPIDGSGDTLSLSPCVLMATTSNVRPGCAFCSSAIRCSVCLSARGERRVPILMMDDDGAGAAGGASVDAICSVNTIQLKFRPTKSAEQISYFEIRSIKVGTVSRITQFGFLIKLSPDMCH